MWSSPTIQATQLASVWEVFVAAGIVVYAIVAGFLLWCTIAYRSRGPHSVQAAKFHENKPLEIIWTIVPVLIVAGLFVKTYIVEAAVERVAPNAPVVVDVTGYRWSWRFAYPGRHITVEGTSQNAPTLVLPVDRTVQINLTSSDVVHSFWIPAFLFKRDANPGTVNVFDLNPTRTGTYRGTCAEFCGTYHADMAFAVRVVSQHDYERWLASGGKL